MPLANRSGVTTLLAMLSSWGPIIYNRAHRQGGRFMASTQLNRRTFLWTTAAGTAVLGVPRPLRAQAPTFKIGAIHPVTGPLAEPGQACRVGAQMAVDAVNAAGGIKSKGRVKLELPRGDTHSKPENGRGEAEPLLNPGPRELIASVRSA